MSPLIGLHSNAGYRAVREHTHPATSGARQIRQVKRTAARPFIHSIDGLVARRRPSGSHTAQGSRSASGSAKGMTSRWVMEKARENALDPMWREA
jgi:hypothetical protein